MSLFAKSSEVSLRDHTNHVLKVTQNVELDERTKFLLEKAALFHDLGKFLPSFQRKIAKIGKFDAVRNLFDEELEHLDVPHSFASLAFVPQDLLKSLNEEEAKILLSSIIYHHWRESYIDYLMGHRVDDVKRLFRKILEWKDQIEKLVKEEIPDAEVNEPLCEYFSQNSLVESGLITPPHVMYTLPSFILNTLKVADKLYKKYTMVLGSLMRADRFASYCETSGESFESVDIKPNWDSFQVVGEKLERSFGKPWQIEFLKGSGLKGKSLILIAPTGAGKSEFAMMWSLGKTLFTLPIRSAVNMMYDRVCSYFGEEHVGLLHSDADLHLEFSVEGDYEGEIDKIVELSKFLSYPFIISTGDQIFPAALKYPGYEMVYSTLSSAYLIVDEAQAYSPEAAAIVVKLLEDASILGSKFLLMTATLPMFLRNEIERRVDKVIIQDMFDKIPQGKITRTAIEIKLNGNLVEDAVRYYSSGKKVLIVRNTVKTAIDTFLEISKKLGLQNVMIIHSRMTLEDRREIERRLNYYRPGGNGDPVILVATQVVEASLDIDFDILLTDIAPADSLVQRMGRVNRKRELIGDEPNTVIYLFSDKSGISTFRGVYNKDLILQTLINLIEIKIENTTGRKLEDKILKVLKKTSVIKRLSEIDKKKLVEEVYQQLQLYDQRKKDTSYFKKFYATLETLDNGYASERKQDALRIFRRISSVDVIPENLVPMFSSELKKLPKDVRYSELKKILAKYMISTFVPPEKRILLEKIDKILDSGSSRIHRFLAGKYILRGTRYERGIGLFL